MSSAAQKPRVRFAPSPTGFLHVGGARTALYNWLFARHLGGTFILRIEDTDRTRSTDEAAAQIIDSMKWLGLDWDEGPVHQSQRLDLYRKGVQRLIEKGAAFESDEERGRCVRFRVPDSGQITMDDSVHGEVAFDVSLIEDFVILRADGFPTYNYACVIDDADMGITHVIRGDDHISNTPRQLLIIDALDMPRPRYAHIPMILGDDGARLSKRHGATSVMEYRTRGFLAPALVNFLALLGWSPGEDLEIMTLDDMVEKFTLDRVGKTSSRFDHAKLLWLNGHYLRQMSDQALAGELAKYAKCFHPQCAQRFDAQAPHLSAIYRERLKTLADLFWAAAFYFEDDITLDEEAVRKVLVKKKGAALLIPIAEVVQGVGEFTEAALETALGDLAAERDVGFGKIAQAARAALTGSTRSPGIFDVLVLLGRERSVARLRDAARFAQTIDQDQGA